MSCLYAGCKNSRNFSSFSFFKIPNDYRKEIWIKHSKPRFPLPKWTFYCEKHFYAKDIKIMGTWKCLKPNAIPIPCAAVCKCTESVVDGNCFRMMNTWTTKNRQRKSIIVPSAITEIQNNSLPLLTTKTEKVCNVQNQSEGEEIKIKRKILPELFELQQIDKNLHSTKQRTYLKSKIAYNFSKNDPEPMSYSNERTSHVLKESLNIIDQTLMTRDDKKIECLEAVVNYTSQMQSIVKEKQGLNSIIEANYHLIELLDKIIYEWFNRAQRCAAFGVMTDQSFIHVALEFKQIFCVQHFNPDQEWLERFKIKYNITDLAKNEMLHVENNRFPYPVNVYDIVLHVLKRNPIEQYFSNSCLKDEITSGNENNIEIKTHIKTENDIETIVKTEEIDIEEQAAILNAKQARLHLKPLEEYVLLKDNLRALGLISQLMKIFSAEIQEEYKAE